MIRFGEARAAAEVAYLEKERQSAAEKANALLGTKGSALVAVLDASIADPPAETATTANRDPQVDGNVLALGQEVLSKLYQSYLYEGTPLSWLLWQEREVYRAELEYRVSVVRSVMHSSIDP
jgi:hypothetical protein